MKIGVTLNDAAGLESEVCVHFGQCSHFLLVDAEDGKIKASKVVENKAVHGGGGCQAVSEIMKYGITYVIAGGMGMGAQQRFASAGIPIFSFCGKAKDAVEALLAGKISKGIEPCKEHEKEGECH